MAGIFVRFVCFLCFPAVVILAKKADVSGPVIGIDLGTTYSCVGIYKNGKVEIIANDQGNRITPSYVAWDSKNKRLIGDAAKNQATLNVQRTVFDVKRLIGRDYADPLLQQDLQYLPFRVIEKKKKPFIQIDNKQYSPEEISAMILTKMKRIAEAYLGQEVTNAVITVPAYFNDAQRQATKDAGTIAGLNVHRIINEPTAGAIAYGIGEKTKPKMGNDEHHVLVFDLGGGTFDVTLLTIDQGVFEVLATDGDTHLGGEDFDQRLMNYFLKKIEKTKGGANIRQDKRAIQKLRFESERIKRALSLQFNARFEIDGLTPSIDVSETITRAKFEDLNQDLFKKTLEPVKKVLQDAKLKKSDIQDIVMIGGSTRIPKITQLIQQFFQKKPNQGVNPDEAVAYGAAVQAGIIAGIEDETNKDILLLDVSPLSMGISTKGGLMSTLIYRNTAIPTTKSKQFVTSKDNQKKVTFKVYEGERPFVKDNHLLGKFSLTGFPILPRGEVQFDVVFQIDANGITHVSAAEKFSGLKEKITITSENGRLSAAEIEQMVEDARKNSKLDIEQEENIRERHFVEHTAYNTKKIVEKMRKRMSQNDVKLILNEVKAILEWLSTHQEETKRSYEEKLKRFQSAVDALFKKYEKKDKEKGEKVEL